MIAIPKYGYTNCRNENSVQIMKYTGILVLIKYRSKTTKMCKCDGLLLYKMRKICSCALCNNKLTCPAFGWFTEMEFESYCGKFQNALFYR